MKICTEYIRKYVFFSFLIITFHSYSQKCIDLGVGIEVTNNEWALIDFFKNNQAWSVSDANGKEWYACADLNEFKIVNGAYYNYDRDWSCDVNNDAWGEPWDDTYISYWDMMIDQGKVRADGYPKQFPTTIYRYQTKAQNPAQPVDSTQAIELTNFTRRMYFPDGIPRNGWVMKWEGTGTITFQGLENVVADAGTIATQGWESWTPAGYGFAGYNYTFESTGNGRIETDLHWMVHGWVLEITDSDPNDPIRNVVMLFPGLENEYDAGQRFHPSYIERMSQFNTLRYMGYLNSNNIESRAIRPECNPFRYTEMLKWLRWDERTPENWYRLDNGNGGNYEYIIELSNLTKTDPWVNIPYCAGESYTDSLVQLFMEGLDPDLTLYLEVGNEMWNFASGFSGFHWQAALRVIEYPGLGDVEGRGAHINKIFAQVGRTAGAENLPRIQRVYAGFPRYTDVNNRTLNYIDQNNWDALATTWYFNLPQDADGNGCTDPATGENWRSTLYNWWVNNPNNQQGFNEVYRDCLLNQFRCGGGYRGNSDVVLANFYGKYTVCYEGGNHSFYGCENAPTGGSLAGELDFDTPDYPDYITDNGFINAVAIADESDAVAEVYSEVIDSMQSAGIRLANHLSFSGRSSCYGVWSFIQPRDLDKSLDYLLTNYGKFRVFSERIQNNNCTQLEIVLESDTVGAGLSIMLDGVNDYIQTNISGLPRETENYSVEFWMKPTYENILHTAFSMNQSSGNQLTSKVFIRNDNKLVWTISDTENSYVKLVGSEIKKDTWNHVAISQNGNRYTLYINGQNKASVNATIPSERYGNLLIGSELSGNYWGGEIDEFRIWETARSQNDIREYMCKKVPDSYNAFSDLIAYYRFDTPDYQNFEVYDRRAHNQTASLENITITARSRYAISGAALGDYSNYIYPASWNSIGLSLRHPDGDMFAVSNLGDGNPNGVHVYIIDEAPYYNTAPEYYSGISTSRAFGIFTANGEDAHYDISYMYQGNPDALTGSQENNHRLLRRDTYASEDWMHGGAKQNLTANTLSISCKEQYRGEYILAFREAENPVRPGSGMALRNSQVPTGNIQGKAMYLKLNDYTVSFWARGWGEVFNFTGKFHANEQKFTISPAWAEGLNCGMRCSYNWGGTQNFGPGGRVALLDEWKHYTVTKDGTKLTIYVNGEEAASMQLLQSYLIEEMYLFNDPAWQTGNYIDGHADLTIDEFRVWDIPLDQATIRDWMCKKINENHPYECENLVLYFNFDEGTGTVIEDKRGPSDIVLSTDESGFEWVRSGAAIGDESIHDYNSASDITMIHPQGDSLVALRTSGTSSAVHLYRVDNMAPAPSTVSDAAITSLDSTRYWGLYVVDTYEAENTYALTNYYADNAQVNLAREDEIRQVYRYNNASTSWQVDLAVTPAIATHSITITGQERGEYILGGTSANTFNEYATPLAPVFLSENTDTNKTAFCGNETGLFFGVEEDLFAESYIWILPDEMNGSSFADTIIISVDYNGSSILNTNIGVAAVNAWGISDTSWYSVEISPSPTIADAGPDVLLLPPGTSTTLDGNTPATGETGTWSLLQGNATISELNNAASTVDITVSGRTQLRWSIDNGVCPASTDSMMITYAPSPIAIEMADGSPLLQTICEGETVTFKAIPYEDITPDSYEWTVPSGMQILSQNADEITVLIGDGYGGSVSVAAVYNGVSSEPFESVAVGISAMPPKPVFADTISVLCLEVDQTLSLLQNARIDSLDWTLPYGIYPTRFPKSTDFSIEVQGIFEVEGWIKVQAFYNGCSSTDAADSMYVTVNTAPEKPILYLGTDGGTADPICRSENALLWVENNNPNVQYEWQWNTNIAHIRYFGENKNGALFTMPGGNSDIQVRAITNDIGCNISEWNEFYGWTWDNTPSTVNTITITDPAGQNTDNLIVGETYTITVGGTGENYFWNVPDGFELIDDGNINNEVNQIRVANESAGTIEVFPITLEGCAGDAGTIDVSVNGTIYPPEYVSGNTTICQSTNLNITVSDVGASEYIWTLPNGTVYTTTTNVLNQLIATPQKGILTVVASNGTYTSLPLEINITVMAAILEATGFVDYNNNPLTSIEVCSTDRNKAVYHRNANAGSYIWNIAGSAIQFEPRWEPGHNGEQAYELSNRTSPTDTMMPISFVDWRTRGDGTDGGYIYVTAENACGGADVKDSIYYYWAIPMNQQVPEFTLAPTNVCVGSTVSYQINEVPFADSYIWHMPGGLLVTDNVTTLPSITAQVENGTGGVVEVYAISDVCGSSQTVVQTSKPITISGEPVDLHFTNAPTAACLGEELTFTVNDIGATSYLWSFPDGLSSTILDNSDAGVQINGSWANINRANMIHASAITATHYNENNTVTYTPDVTFTGIYKVWISYFTRYDNRADVPVRVTHANGTNNMYVNMQLEPENGIWHELGEFTFNAGTSGSVTIGTNASGGGISIADAVRFELIGIEDDNEIAMTVHSDEGGAVCVAVSVPECSSPYSICTEPLNLTGELETPVFVYQENSVCEGVQYTFRVNDIGAENYIWTLPADMSIGGETGEVTTSSREVVVDMNTDPGVPVNISVRGSIPSCGIESATIQSGNITFDGADCKLATPVFVLPEENIIVPNTVEYFITEVPFAENYTWIIPNGLQQSGTGAKGEIVTTTTSIILEADGSLWGTTNMIKVVAKATGLEESDTAYTPFNINILQQALPEAAFSTSEDGVCIGEEIVLTDESKNAENYIYQWNFGAGAVPASYTGSTPPNVSYSSFGNKTITLSIVNGQGDVLSESTYSIVVFTQPAISSVDAPILCEGGSANAEVDLQGTAPFEITYSLNGNSTITQSVNESPFVISITETDIVQITSLTDAYCSSSVSEEITPIVYPVLVTTISGDSEIYSGEPAEITVDFEGTPPWNITIADTLVFTNITETPFSFIVTSPGIYTIESVNDNYCNGVGEGSATVSLIGYEYATLSGKDSVCAGDTGELLVELEGVAPWNVTLTNGTDTYTENNIDTNRYIFTDLNPGSYTISNATDSEGKVLATEGSGEITTRTNSLLATVLNDTICPGETGTIELSIENGNSPWTISLTNNLGTIDYQVLSANAQIQNLAVGDYTITALADRYCRETINEAVSVISYTQPTATISGNAFIEEGDTATINIALTGESPWSIGLSNGDAYNNITANAMTIDVTEAAVYTITSIHDAHCTGIASGEATIQYFDIPTATLTGGGAICQGEPLPPVIVSLNGVSPWTITYQVNDSILTTTVSSSPYTIPVQEESQILLLSVTDANGIAGEVSGSVQLSIHAIPTLIIPNEANTCFEDEYNLDVQFTGTPPWNITINDETFTYTEANITFDDIDADEYIFTNLSDNYCSSLATDTFTLVRYDRVTATISGSTNFCNPNDASLDVQLTGNAPWILNIHSNNGSQTYNNITTELFSIPLENGLYSLESVSDAYCTGTADTNTVVYVSNVESPNIEDLEALYGDDPVIINEDGDTVRWYEDPTLQQFIVENYSFNPNVSEIGVYTYFVTRTEGNCESIADSVTLTINPNTNIYGSAQACANVETQYFTQNNNTLLYTWNITGGTIVSGQNTNSVRVVWDESATDHSIALTETLQSDNSVQNSSELTVAISGSQAIIFDTFINICEQSAQISITNATATSRYNWIADDATITLADNRQSAELTFDAAGTYPIAITETYSVGCPGEDTSFSITFDEKSDIDFTIPQRGYTGIDIQVPYSAPANTQFQYHGDLTTISSFAEDNDTIRISPNGTGKYSLIVRYTDPANGCLYTSELYTLNILPIPEPQINGADSVCVYDSGLYTLLNATNLSSVWQSNSNITITKETEQSAQLEFNETGDLVINISFYDLAVTQQEITSTIFSVHVDDLPAPEIDGPSRLCTGGGAIDYTVSGYSSSSYAWATNALSANKNENTTTLSVGYVAAGDYYVAVVETSQSGTCYGADSLYITVLQAPQLGGYRTIEHCFDEEPRLMVEPDSGFAEYNINNTIETNPQVLFTEPGYLAYSVTEGECETFDTVFVVDGCSSKFVVPEAFSPNNDGLNDVLEIFGHHFENLNFIIVNKWGEVVYKYTGTEEFWDGTYNGTPAPNGTYTWQAKFTDPEHNKVKKTGKVVLMR